MQDESITGWRTSTPAAASGGCFLGSAARQQGCTPACMSVSAAVACVTYIFTLMLLYLCCTCPSWKQPTLAPKTFTKQDHTTCI